MKKLKTFFLVLLVIPALSQTFEKDMEQMHKKFVNAAHIAYTIRYVLKESHDEGSRIVSESTGKYIKDNDTYLSVLDDKATLVTPRQVVLVDREQKRISVKQVKEKIQETNDLVKMLKLSTETAQKINRREVKNQIVYDVILKSEARSPLERYQVKLNSETFYMESVTLFYKKALEPNKDYRVSGKEIPRLDIFFGDFDDRKINTDPEIQTDYYFTKLNNKLSPTLNFKGYAIKEIF